MYSACIDFPITYGSLSKALKFNVHKQILYGNKDISSKCFDETKYIYLVIHYSINVLYIFMKIDRFECSIISQLNKVECILFHFFTLNHNMHDKL